MNMLPKEKVAKFRKIVIACSIAIPLAVAALFRIRIPDVDFSFLPPFYATINGVTAFLLILALVAIKQGRREIHERYIKFSLLLSILFLVCYVAYHMTSDPTPFGGLGAIKYIYYFILISHIALSVAVIPLVLFTYLFAWEGDFVKHKKWSKITWPLWFYVAVTGVVVYLMIAPYYGA